MVKDSITIVTAFFDIGRSDWSIESGHSSYLKRTTEEYFNYFENLAKLNNMMVVFTTENLKKQILDIRGDLPTKVIVIDLERKFTNILKKIERIQNLDEFKNMIKPEQLKNPECWSSQYVLINNLKSYFVCKALLSCEIKDELVAWVDFGYCRHKETLNNCIHWNYKFNKEKINLFTIKKRFPLKSKVPSWEELLNSNAYFIGGCVVAAPDLWMDFNRILWEIQQEFLDHNVVDDDQNVVLKAYLLHKEIFKINYLGKNDWFALFQKYGHNKTWFQKLFNQ